MKSNNFQEVYDKAYIFSTSEYEKIKVTPKKINAFSRLLQEIVTHVSQSLDGQVTIVVQFNRDIPRNTKDDDKRIRMKVLTAFEEVFGIDQNTAFTKVVIYSTIKPINKDLVQVITE